MSGVLLEQRLNGTQVLAAQGLWGAWAKASGYPDADVEGHTEALLSQIASGGGAITVAWSDGEPVGLFEATRGYDPLTRSTVAIAWTLYVDRLHRGKGIARELIARYHRDAGEWGATRCVIPRADAGSRDVYAQMGYREVGVGMEMEL